MRQYELVVMFDLSANEIGSEKNVTAKIKKNDLKVIGLDKWGVEPLAYPINKQTKAYYLVYNLEGETEQIGKLEQDLKLDETILRWLLVRI
jgi:small subunit ribosomal protein S6